MIRDFEHWNTTLSEASQLEELRGLRVGIEAANYLTNRILLHPHAKEPLVTALGGVPLGFRQHIEKDLKKFADAGIEPLFVFSGLDISKQDNPFRQRQEGSQINAEAWSLYDSHLATKSVSKFGESTYVTPEDLFRALQAILVEKKVSFLVAPYSAWAQLAYLEKQQQVQAISGSSEILLFDSDKIITSWELETDMFRWIKRSQCIADLRKYVRDADIADEQFVDACILAGTHFLPTLPNLELPNRSKQPKPVGAIDMIMSQGRSGYSVVLNNKDDPMFERTNYYDRYRKTRLAVKHHPVLTVEGKIEPLLQTQLPNDSHEFVGQRLPDEVYYYMSRGLINARVLSWRANSEIIESPPIDGGDSREYENLVSQKLTPLRTTAINLLSSSLHNWFQHKDIDLKCWFQTDPSGKTRASTISMKGLPEWRKSVDTWNVREAMIQEAISKHNGFGRLGSAILALQDSDFISKSVSKKDYSKPLTTTDEILYNSIWRFLALREYIDTDHKLTAWGNVLIAAITALKGKPDLEEGAVIAVELLRLNVLNADPEMFPTYSGSPMRGEEKDRKFNLLISRVAGLGNLRHNPIGFTGPLSQHLLAYGSIINLVRQTLRDLVEVTATHMFMGAFAKRDMANLSEIAVELPFLLTTNCALSIAVKTYLDEIVNYEAEDPAQAKARVRDGGIVKYFPQSVDVLADLATGFELWDAVFEGVKNGGSAIKESEKKYWTEANEWLSAKR